MVKLANVISCLRYDRKQVIHYPSIKQVKQIIFHENETVVCPEPYNIRVLPNSYYLEQLRYSNCRFL